MGIGNGHVGEAMWTSQHGHGQEGMSHKSKKNRTFRPHTPSNFTKIENNLYYVYLNHSVHIHYVYLSHSVHGVHVYLTYHWVYSIHCILYNLVGTQYIHFNNLQYITLKVKVMFMPELYLFYI